MAQETCSIAQPKSSNECAPHSCDGHDASHKHGPDCGHEPIRHDDHVDYVVNGHLHHPHGDHCDDHGPVAMATAPKPMRRG